MLKYILLCSFLAHTLWAKPVSEGVPHVLIVTPQAHLRLDSLVPGSPVIQHLSPFTRFIAPHEETIVYVPASAAAAAAAAVQNADILSRSLEGGKIRQISPQDISSSISSIATSSIQNIQSAAQSAAQSASESFAGSSSYIPSIGNPASSFQTAVEGFIQGAQSTVSGFQTPTPQSAPQESAQATLFAAETPIGSAHLKLPILQQSALLPYKEEDQAILTTDTAYALPNLIPLKIKSLPILSGLSPAVQIFNNEPRHYVVAPSVPHVFDYVPGSIVVTPTATATIKARRSILAEKKEPQPLLPIILSEPAKPIALPLTEDLEKEEKKNAEFKRFLEANALKEEPKEEQQQQQLKAKKDKPLKEEQKDQLELQPQQQQLKTTENLNDYNAPQAAPAAAAEELSKI